MVRTPTDPGYVRDLFSGAARYYERVNLVTSLGQVTLWRREVIRMAQLRPGDQVLDAFCGPGSLSRYALPQLSDSGRLVLVDLSPVMLEQAKTLLASVAAARGQGSLPRVDYVAGDLLRDDLGLGGFDVVLEGWGLRYVDHIGETLSRLRSFLRPGGRLVLLEFTRPPRLSWATPAHLYFRRVLPVIGSALAHNQELHDYLRESAAGFPSAAELARLVTRAGFGSGRCRGHLGGLITIIAASLE